MFLFAFHFDASFLWLTKFLSPNLNWTQSSLNPFDSSHTNPSIKRIYLKFYSLTLNQGSQDGDGRPGSEAGAWKRRTWDGGFLDMSVSRTGVDEERTLYVRLKDGFGRRTGNISENRTETDAGRRRTKSVPRALLWTVTVPSNLTPNLTLCLLCVFWQKTFDVEFESISIIQPMWYSGVRLPDGYLA